MTRTLDLSPEQEQTLERRARRAGMDVDAYLNHVLQKITTTRKRRPVGYSETWTDEDMREASMSSLADFEAAEEAND